MISTFDTVLVQQVGHSGRMNYIGDRSDGEWQPRSSSLTAAASRCQVVTARQVRGSTRDLSPSCDSRQRPVGDGRPSNAVVPTFVVLPTNVTSRLVTSRTDAGRWRILAVGLRAPAVRPRRRVRRHGGAQVEILLHTYNPLCTSTVDFSPDQSMLTLRRAKTEVGWGLDDWSTRCNSGTARFLYSNLHAWELNTRNYERRLAESWGWVKALMPKVSRSRFWMWNETRRQEKLISINYSKLRNNKAQWCDSFLQK